MNYYVQEGEIHERLHKTAGFKARKDIEDILEARHFQPLEVVLSPLDENNKSIPAKVKHQLDVYRAWKHSCASLKKGDVLFIQFPLIETTLLFAFLCVQLRKRGILVVALLHDLESLRIAKLGNISWRHKLKIHISEISILKRGGKVIVHNENMKKRLVEMGVQADRLVPLGIFDYLVPGYHQCNHVGKIEKNLPVIIAGNLRKNKSAYAYSLPDNCPFNLYGVDFEGKLPAGSHYFGAFPPDELPYILEGSFGLVWDGNSVNTCAGIYGKYLQINNPHKASLYLAAGVPLAVWSQAALADFVKENNVGIVIDSIHDLKATLNRMTSDEYAEKKRNAAKIGSKIRKAYFTNAAIDKILNANSGDEDSIK